MLAGLLALLAAFALASPAAAGTIYTLDPGAAQTFNVDGQDYTILAAGFDLDIGTRVLSDFRVIGDGATLTIDQAHTLDAITATFLQFPAGVTATLAVEGSSSSILNLTGFFIGDALAMSFTFSGNGEGQPDPPDLNELLFSADAGGTLPDLPPVPGVPEPTAALLFGVGLIVASQVLRRRSTS